MKRTPAAGKNNSQQMSLLDVDTRDPGQVMADLEKQRDLINRCLTLGEEIIALVDKDAERLLADIRASEAHGIDEMKRAMGKRNGHLSQEFHKQFNIMFSKAMREMSETHLTILKNALVAMDEVGITTPIGPHTRMEL